MRSFPKNQNFNFTYNFLVPHFRCSPDYIYCKNYLLISASSALIHTQSSMPMNVRFYLTELHLDLFEYLMKQVRICRNSLELVITTVKKWFAYTHMCAVIRFSVLLSLKVDNKTMTLYFKCFCK